MDVYEAKEPKAFKIIHLLGRCTVCEISSSHGGKYEDYRAFWDIAPCSIVVVDQFFRGVYCLHHQGNRSISQKTLIFRYIVLPACMCLAIQNHGATLNVPNCFLERNG
jgi:hypothetical protein